MHQNWVGKHSRKKPRRNNQYFGPWNVVFSCGHCELVAIGTEEEAKMEALKNHECKNDGCSPQSVNRITK